MAGLGLWPIGTRPFGTLPHRGVPAFAVFSSAGLGAASFSSIVKANSALTASGQGGTSFALMSQNFSHMNAAGAGAFAPVLTAGASASLNASGQGGFGGADAPASRATFAGNGAVAAVSYAFYADAEKAAPMQEIRVAYVPYDYTRFYIEPPAYVPFQARATYASAENRVAFAPAENRMYEVRDKKPTPLPPNRRRTL